MNKHELRSLVAGSSLFLSFLVAYAVITTTVLAAHDKPWYANDFYPDHAHHLIASLTQAEKDQVAQAVTRFASDDVPALNSCNMRPSMSIRYVSHPLTQLSAMGLQ